MGIIIDINMDTIYPILNYKNSNMFWSKVYQLNTHIYTPDTYTVDIVSA